MHYLFTSVSVKPRPDRRSNGGVRSLQCDPPPSGKGGVGLTGRYGVCRPLQAATVASSCSCSRATRTWGRMRGWCSCLVWWTHYWPMTPPPCARTSGRDHTHTHTHLHIDTHTKTHAHAGTHTRIALVVLILKLELFENYDFFFSIVLSAASQCYVSLFQH